MLVRTSIFALGANLAITSANHCNFGQWGEWSACSATCGSNASRQRQQVCSCVNSISDHGGSGDFQDPVYQCSDGDLQTEIDLCGYSDCQDTNWGSWSSLGCSEPCGGGMEIRERVCYSDGDEVDEDNCQGNSQTMFTCNPDACEDGENDIPTTADTLPLSTPEVLTVQTPTGQWLNWGSWSPCTKTCDSGKRFRERSAQTTEGFYISSASTTFKYTNGDQEYESESCNDQSCGQCNYQQWSSWTSCAGKCGTETTTRQRQCACNGVASYCTGDGRWDPTLDDPTDRYYDTIENGDYQHESGFCEDHAHDEDCNAQPQIPVISQCTFIFISFVLKDHLSASNFFADDGFSQPADQQKWEYLNNDVELYININMGINFPYAMSNMNHKPADQLLTDYDSAQAAEIAIPIETSVTFTASADNPLLSVGDMLDNIGQKYNSFPKVSAYTGNSNRRVHGRRKRSTTTGSIVVSDNNAPTLTDTRLFDNRNLNGGTTQTLISLYPEEALYTMMNTFHTVPSDTANLLLTGCHCMKFGSYSANVQKLLGGSNSLNDLDDQCQKSFGQTRCAFLDGGRCNAHPNLRTSPYVVEYDAATSMLDCTSVGTWQPTYDNDQLACVNELCLIHNYYYQGIIDYINTNGGITAQPGIDLNNLLDNQCVHPGNAHTVTCAGNAPHLRFVKNP